MNFAFLIKQIQNDKQVTKKSKANIRNIELYRYNMLYIDIP